MKVIDLSGYSFSGKSAVYDLLSEFNGYAKHSKEFEFELIRVPNGIHDLYNNLVINWSPVRSSEAIRSFQRLIKIYSGDNSFFSRLFRRGYKYDMYFPNFKNISNDLVEKLIISRWQSEWPFALNSKTNINIFLKKILFRLGFKRIFETEVFLSRFEKEEFLIIIKEYLNKLLLTAMNTNDKAIILNNAFESFYPLSSQQFFYNARSIIVDRDPRDIYLSALKGGVVNGVNVGFAVTGGCVDNFIKRFKTYRNNIEINTKILRITFEDLVLNYEQTLNMIFDFLEEDKSIHKYPKKYFDPEISKKGVSIWKTVDGQLKKDIDKIQLELKEYCKNY